MDLANVIDLAMELTVEIESLCGEGYDADEERVVPWFFGPFAEWKVNGEDVTRVHVLWPKLAVLAKELRMALDGDSLGG